MTINGSDLLMKIYRDDTLIGTAGWYPIPKLTNVSLTYSANTYPIQPKQGEFIRHRYGLTTAKCSFSILATDDDKWGFDFWRNRIGEKNRIFVMLMVDGHERGIYKGDMVFNSVKTSGSFEDNVVINVELESNGINTQQLTW